MNHNSELSNIIGKSIDERTVFSRSTLTFFMMMRHGQASYTKEENEGVDIVEGQLTQEGKERITTAAQEIADQLIARNIHTLQIITSTKTRCRQTSDIIVKSLADKQITTRIEINPDLRDVKVIGPKNGRTGSYSRWEESMLPGENWFLSWKRKAAAGMQFYDGEESPKNIEKRVSGALKNICETPSPVPYLLVCHEEVLDSIAHILNFPLKPPTYGEIWYINPEKNCHS